MTAKPPDKYTADRFKWLDQIVADPNQTPLCFLVAYVIATHMNRATGDAWPGQDRLAVICHTTDRNIRRALTQMKLGGHLEQVGRGGRSLTSRYTPVLRDIETRTPMSTFEVLNPDANVHVKPPKPGRIRPKTRTDSSAKPGRQCPTIPLREPIEETIEDKTLPEFEIWWGAYPKKVGEKPAQKIYARIIKKRRATHAELLAGATQYSTEQAGNEQKYIKEAKNWLSGEHWKDEPATQHHRKSETRSRADSAVDGMRGYLEDQQ
jgi:quinol monooxygenase YgiN